MKILHLASFDGNIGDNASHIGFRKLLSEFIHDYHLDNLEIRKFYNNYDLPDKLRFDDDFVTLANKYDLLFIGGGGYLDFWVKNSATGTTLNISRDILHKLKVPIIISSVGCMPHKEVPDGNIEKFRDFLDQLLSRNNTYVAVRNDGSKQTLKDYIGLEYYNRIPEVLDHGFFYDNDGSLYSASEQKYIIINTTSDQLLVLNRHVGKISNDSYASEMGLFINHIINETKLNIAFAPHIYSDYKAIELLLNEVNNFHIRTRVAITPYVQGDYGCNQIFSAYKNSSLVIGMRFHANVCSIAMNKPSIGIAALDRVVSVYESVGMGDNLVPVDDLFGDKLISKTNNLLTTSDKDLQPTDLFKTKKENTKKIYSDIFSQLGVS